MLNQPCHSCCLNVESGCQRFDLHKVQHGRLGVRPEGSLQDVWPGQRWISLHQWVQTGRCEVGPRIHILYTLYMYTYMVHIVHIYIHTSSTHSQVSTLLGANLRCDEIEELMTQADLVSFQMNFNIFGDIALISNLCCRLRSLLSSMLIVHCAGREWIARLWRVCQDAYRYLILTFFPKNCIIDFVLERNVLAVVSVIKCNFYHRTGYVLGIPVI